jgi:F0F1-type ATP synthase membrane subunit b/b'
MREQSRREIESAGKAARLELRKFAAQESVRLAEEILKREMGPEDDARLTRLNVNELGRAQH